MKLVTNKFKLGGLQKHVVATWYFGNHLSICLWTEGNQEKPVSRWPVAGPYQELFPCRKWNHDMVISSIGRAVSFTSELSDQAKQLLLIYAGSHM